MSDSSNRFLLAEIGQKAAQVEILPEHFPQAFDPGEEAR
jgi:hypothetical protein